MFSNVKFYNAGMYVSFIELWQDQYNQKKKEGY